MVSFVEREGGAWSDKRKALSKWCDATLDEIARSMRVMLADSSDELVHFVMLCSTEVGRNVVGYQVRHQERHQEEYQEGYQEDDKINNAGVEIQCRGLRVLDKMLGLLAMEKSEQQGSGDSSLVDLSKLGVSFSDALVSS